MAREFKPVDYVIVDKIAVLSQRPSKWMKELNIVKWDEMEPKYDIREWSPDHSRIGRGITLTEEEASILYQALATRDLRP